MDEQLTYSKKYEDKVIHLNGINQLKQREWNYPVTLNANNGIVTKGKAVANSSSKLMLGTVQATRTKGKELLSKAKKDDAFQQATEQLSQLYIKASKRPLFSSVVAVGILAIVARNSRSN
ncbi:hypothetical protein [Aquibacillus salsiterrae]|uniref:Uncharacterized protein n=1 Tax=Aquibacillus salsiterrae TaxID=2950439 RepID=A0A9X4AHP5_9BACI|nr:hypothetical protein [Aquibacillus salsiterrae]MDC3418433.1 hypothetical protein [Aquibacillus salsiterrae]